MQAGCLHHKKTRGWGRAPRGTRPESGTAALKRLPENSARTREIVVSHAPRRRQAGKPDEDNFRQERSDQNHSEVNNHGGQ